MNGLRRILKPTFRSDEKIEVKDRVDGCLNSYIIIPFFQVCFVGEPGSDGGGLTREFLSLFAKSRAWKYLEITGVFRHNALAVQVLYLSFAAHTT